MIAKTSIIWAFVWVASTFDWKFSGTRTRTSDEIKIVANIMSQ